MFIEFAEIAIDVAYHEKLRRISHLLLLLLLIDTSRTVAFNLKMLLLCVNLVELVLKFLSFDLRVNHNVMLLSMKSPPVTVYGRHLNTHICFIYTFIK